MSHVADFSLQADETPCTILYTIGEQKVDVGKATIMELKKPSQTAATAVSAAKHVVADLPTSLVMGVFTWTRQNAEKNAEDFPLANFLGAPAPAPAPVPAPAPAPAPDVLGGASSLAELDALTVSVTPAPFNINV